VRIVGNSSLLNLTRNHICNLVVGIISINESGAKGTVLGLVIIIYVANATVNNYGISGVENLRKLLVSKDNGIGHNVVLLLVTFII
jgi:hypothetical protein